ncbi:hypothetical protein MP228_002856 [Amoeboaphelidium protococcarum]|nr:hypothetical protein MP228_002856 [Amoeboaphelidium protococcarum]
MSQVVKLQNFVSGQYQDVAGSGENFLQVSTPHDGSVIAQVPLTDASAVDAAIQSAHKAYLSWSQLTLKSRVAYLTKYLHLVEFKYKDELARIINLEHGKTIPEAMAEISKGNETLEYAISLQNQKQGNHMEVSRGVFCQDDRLPLGVVASIVPFNFPYMVPFWTIGHVLACGNTLVLKPSEKVPMTMNKVAAIWKEAGLPDGVFTLLNGTRQTVEAIVDHPLVKAMTFVGTSNVAELLYHRCSQLNKRVLALGGAKNHLVAAPDCDVAMTSQDVVNSFAGCSGQRCMAASVLLIIGQSQQQLIDQIVQKAAAVSAGKDAGQIGPVIDEQSMQKIVRYIDEAESKYGAQILLDGRKWCKEHKSGYWVGPTIILHKSSQDPAMKEEIFGPVLSIYQCESPQQAVDIQNSSQYGNAAAIYTQDAKTADWFLNRFQAGMMGLNIGVPVPREPFSFGGIKRSKFGFVGDITGDSAVEFFTWRRKVTKKWGKPDVQTWLN